MLEDFMTPTTAESMRAGALGDHVERFCVQLVEVGYSPGTIREKLWAIKALAAWMTDNRRTVVDLDEWCIDKFLEKWRWRGRPVRQRCRSRRVALLDLVDLLRAEAVVPPSEFERDDSDVAALVGRYETYLRRERALADCTIKRFAPIARLFIGERMGTRGLRVDTLDVDDVRHFMLAQVRSVAPRTAQVVGCALRSFLRFLFLHGDTKTDLGLAVPTVRQGRQANIPRYIPESDVEKILRHAGVRSSPAARRDYAILVLLARLGLRACEVIRLELDDLRWREGEIIVRGKGLIRDRLPLLSEVGKALALYLKKERPVSDSRRVFLRGHAPYRSLGHPSTVSTIGARAIAQAGLAPARRGVYLFRHSLATAMVRRGASFAEIGQVLRHRSPNTTEIYDKLDFGALHDIALPWPIIGGAR